MRPQEAIRAAISDRRCTLRVMLRVEDGGPRLTLTTWKISAGGNVADNYWREGNLLAKPDQQTGRILHCTTVLGPRYRTVEHHPRTAMPLGGFQVPSYREAVDMALHASTALATHRPQSRAYAIPASRPHPLELKYYA